jgi:threonine dehydrogenase-like Zn-dependent dehydrogenase
LLFLRKRKEQDRPLRSPAVPPQPARAAVARGRRDVRVEAREFAAPGPGEARVRVRACGLCGSDLHLFELGLYAPGVVPGHEIAGEVEALGPGSGAHGLAVGDAVVVEPLFSCGACAWCRAGRDAICPNGGIFGVRRDGGMAEQMLVPVRRLFRAPRDLAPTIAAFAEPAAVALHGLRRGAFEKGQRVWVLGAGAIGLVTLVAARQLGAREVVVSARHAHQAAFARRLGADRVLRESESTAEALAALPAAERPELVVETIGGQADSVRAAAAAAAPGGAVSVLGLFTRRIELDGFALFAKELTLAWSNCYERGRARADFDDAVALVSGERERLAPLASHAVPLAEVARAYATALDKRAGALKVTVLP